jgi:hypothetical protein
LASFAPTPTSFDTTSVFTTLHLKSNGYFSFFLKNYELDQDLELSSDSFKLAFQCMLHLSASGPFMTIFEHLRHCFHFEDSASGFPQLFQLSFHIAHGHIPPQITCVLGTARLLAMTKPLGGVHPITMEETLY